MILEPHCSLVSWREIEIKLDRQWEERFKLPSKGRFQWEKFTKIGYDVWPKIKMNAINSILDIRYDYSALETRCGIISLLRFFFRSSDSLKTRSKFITGKSRALVCGIQNQSVWNWKPRISFLASEQLLKVLWAWFRVRRTLNRSGSHVPACKRDSNETFLCNQKVSVSMKSVLMTLQLDLVWYCNLKFLLQEMLVGSCFLELLLRLWIFSIDFQAFYNFMSQVHLMYTNLG